MSFTALIAALEDSALGAFVRESLYGFPILVGIHLLSLIFSIGMLLWVDLRMLGIAVTRAPLAAVYRGLAPWFTAGFVVTFGSGFALFAGFASSAVDNVYFRIKIAAIVLAGVNAIVFHFAARDLAISGDAAATPSGRIRAAGAISLALWATTLLCGRMMSYTLF